ncbi:MAG: 4Fe-4S binding protein [Bacillota bacterium]|jgi:ferredoxin
MSYKINDNCISCGACAEVCPVSCIYQPNDEKYSIDADRCIDCGACAEVCPVDAPEKDE